MEINQSLENALKLADLDLNRIQYEIDVDFNGSIDTYFDHVRQLSTDFESALALLVLNSNTAQINAFARLNLTKIDISIKHIKLFDELCSRSQIQIDSDPVNSDIIDGFFRPIHNAHLSQLVYIERLLKNVLKDLNDESTATISENMMEKTKDSEISKNESVAEEKELLSEYSEFLSMKDMSKIFKVNRNAIYKKEKAGHFNRCTLKNQNVMFEKEEIKRYLSARK
jgi:predicted DNA-binding transcriptional regulator AlpA